MNNYLHGRNRQDLGASRNKQNDLPGLAAHPGFDSSHHFSEEHLKQISSDNAHSPKVEVVMEDNTVSRIVITCTCGEIIDLHCSC